MNKLEQNKNLIKLTVIAIVIILTLGLSYIALAVDQLGVESNTSFDEVSGLVDLVPTKGEKTVIHQWNFTGRTSTASAIAADNARLEACRSGAEAQAAETASLLNSLADVFCCKRHKGMASAGTSYITKNSDGGLIDVTRAFTTDPWYSVKENPLTTVDYQEMYPGYSQTITAATASNFKAFLYNAGADLTNHTVAWNHYGILKPENRDVIPFALIFGADKGPGVAYQTNTTQHGVWSVTGYLDDSDYIDYNYDFIVAGKAVTEYHKDRKETSYTESLETIEKITLQKDEDDGTTGTGTYYMEDTNMYRVGPFVMGDYYYAFSDHVAPFFNSTTKKTITAKEMIFPEMIAGIDECTITLTDDDHANPVEFKPNGKGDGKVQIVYEDPYGNPTYIGDVHNKFSGGYKYLQTPDTIASYNGGTGDGFTPYYPLPNAVFYIDISKAECDIGLTNLDKIEFSYRETDDYAMGDVIMTRYITAQWELKHQGPGHFSYYSDENVLSGTGGPSLACEHLEGYDEDGDPIYSTHYCDYTCNHGYYLCSRSLWTLTSHSTSLGQPLLVAHEAWIKITDTPYTIEPNIRLTTNIELKKYVSTIKHDTDGFVTYGFTDEAETTVVEPSKVTASKGPADRREMTDEEKEGDSVYAEYGDLITFKIEIINHQKCNIKLKVLDTLPEDIEVIERDFLDNDWIFVGENETRIFHITVKTLANDGKTYCNKVELITKNNDKEKDPDPEGKNVDFMYVTDGWKGPVVNISEIDQPEWIESKDYYTINDYKMEIYKYVSKYNHEITDFNNKRGFTNESNELENRYETESKEIISEIYKETYPVAVEKTETLEFSIRANNTQVKNGDYDVATRVRTTEIKDTLDEGLQVTDPSKLKTVVYNEDGSEAYTISPENSVLTVNGTELTFTVANKEGETFTAIEPDQYIIFTYEVKVVKTNMYFYKLPNLAEISVLTNINNLTGDEIGSRETDCPVCLGTGHSITGGPACPYCGGTGKETGTVNCPTCNGSGYQTKTYSTCPTCSGTGKQTKTCNHTSNGDGLSYATYKCDTCGRTVVTGEAIGTTCNYPSEHRCTGRVTNQYFCVTCGKSTNYCTHEIYQCSNHARCGAGETTAAEIHSGAQSWRNKECGEEYECDGTYERDYYETYISYYELDEYEHDNSVRSSGYYYVWRCSNDDCGNKIIFAHDWEEPSRERQRHCGLDCKCKSTSYNFLRHEGTEYLSRCTSCGEEYISSWDEMPTVCKAIKVTFCPGRLTLIDCSRCHGTGSYEGTCETCGGAGKIPDPAVPCDSCGGTGHTTGETICSHCHGSKVDGTGLETCPACGGSGTHTTDIGGDRRIFDKKESIDRNIGTQDESREYVRLKDLVIAGKVWLDRDKDGLMPPEPNPEDDEEDRIYDGLSDSPIDHEGKQTSNIAYSSDNEEKPLKGIIVKLYQSDGTLLRTTKTDETGLFTFGKDINLNWLSPSTYERTDITTTTCTVTDSVQRVDKGITKDTNHNYQDGSSYLEYYIEYEYDGILYKATEIYADDEHINDDGSYVDPYERDSNAYEITKVREELNKKYEYVSFNRAQNEFSTTPSFSADLSFDKKGHESWLNIDPARLMTARSFLNRQTDADTSDYVNGFYADGSTKYLWLKDFDASINETPETEYLKYINLGLQEREDADISLLKDIYEVKTTVNGEEVTYTYDQLKAERDAMRGTTGDPFIENGRIAEGPEHTFLNDYVIKEPYGLKLYDSDFFYRKEDYDNATVQAYKGDDSEMNIEVTYKITIDNRSIRDDYKDEDAWKDTQLDLTVNEIVDIYDENFIPIQFKADGTMDEDSSRVLMKKANDCAYDGKNLAVTGTHDTDDEGNPYVKLVPQNVIISAAWYYDNNEVYNASGNENPRHYLTIMNKTSCSAENSLIKNNDPHDSGYNLIYITGMSDVKIEEGQQLDVFVKYTLDKKAEVSTVNGIDLPRMLKILEENTNSYKRGTNPIEGIATIGTYSLWYNTSKKATGIVDCDSNTANIGFTESGSYTHLDDTSIYEDTTYKVDIEMEPTTDMLREMTGMVWDDSRSVAVTEENVKSGIAPITTAYSGPEFDEASATEQMNLTQYSGDGLFDPTIGRNSLAKINEVVTQVYKEDPTVNEDKDIKVRSAKAEYIEIIAIEEEGTNPKIVRYYEDKRPNANAEHVQSIRTNDEGEYTLSGYIPGYYIVRFTYGDSEKFTDDYNPTDPYGSEDSTIATDMLIFNGQDYKSTKYTGVLDTETDQDIILTTIMEENKNDARDDEIKRLQAIAYSERMINFKAEILKGLGNGLSLGGNSYLTPNDSKRNTNPVLLSLLEKTNMYADTNKFYAKPEKVSKLFNTTGIQSDGIYIRQYAKKNTVSQLYDKLFTLTYGDSASEAARKYVIDHIDFGVEYRPETEVSLEKEIDYVRLKLASDSEEKPTVELYFEYSFNDKNTGAPMYDDAGNPVKRLEVIPEQSVGYNVTQVIPNWYTKNNNNYQLTSEFVSDQYEGQGWVNIQMDYEVLQGAQVTIKYSYIMKNESEVDRISKNLDELRYRENTEAAELYDTYVTHGIEDGMVKILKKEYSAAGLASLYLKSITGTSTKKLHDDDLTVEAYSPSIPVGTAGERPESGQDVVKFDVNEGDVVYRTKVRKASNNGAVASKGSGYYGMFLGSYYYTGEVEENDIASKTKFVRLLDYVDTDLRYNAPEQEAKKYKDNAWIETYAEELRRGGFLKSGSTIFVNMGSSPTPTKDALVEGVMNPDDIMYGDLIMTESDRAKDIDEYQVKNEVDPTVNIDMTRFLYPQQESRVQVRLEETLPSDIETNRPEIEYENLGEIIEITTQTGRRTNFDTTIGNVYFDLNYKEEPPTGEPSSPEFIRATFEPDTAATELISINPNPGMTRRERQVHTAIKNTLNMTMVATLVLAVVVIGTISTTVIIKKIKNKPIK